MTITCSGNVFCLYQIFIFCVKESQFIGEKGSCKLSREPFACRYDLIWILLRIERQKKLFSVYVKENTRVYCVCRSKSAIAHCARVVAPAERMTPMGNWISLRSPTFNRAIFFSLVDWKRNIFCSNCWKHPIYFLSWTAYVQLSNDKVRKIDLPFFTWSKINGKIRRSTSVIILSIIQCSIVIQW